MKIFAISDKETLQCVYVGLHKDRAEAWNIYLGWPDAAEVRAAELKSVCEEVHCYPVAQMVRIDG